MMGYAMVLGKVADVVGRARAPVVSELALLVEIAKPPKLHVHGFGATREDVVGNNTKGGAVVSLDGGRGLCVSHFVEEGLAGHGFTCVDVECAQLGFCG